MSSPLNLHADRLFPVETKAREICRDLYESVASLPILSPHGHTDPKWFSLNKPFENPTDLLLTPDHYLVRMLFSQGVTMEQLGFGTKNVARDPKAIWKIFATNYYLYRGTPSSLWLDYVFSQVFNLDIKLDENTADHYYDAISSFLAKPEFLPRSLFDQFNIEVLSTTESPLDNLEHHQTIIESNWNGRIISAFRPDPIVDPEFEGFESNISRLAELTGETCDTFQSYINAIVKRREYFISKGVTSSDHGHPTASTADLSDIECECLYQKIISGDFSANDAEIFRAQMLTEMASMSIADGLVMQIHPGSFRNHNPTLFNKFGRDKGADLPMQTEYVNALKPLLDKYGNNSDLTIILFTLDETTYSRELAPLAGHYPALKLGPSWWFHDSPQGMLRFREQITETAGFYNTVGFNDDTRAFLSIPARHDVARRMDCHFLANLVAQHRIDMNDAMDVAYDLTYGLAKKAYKL